MSNRLYSYSALQWGAAVCLSCNCRRPAPHPLPHVSFSLTWFWLHSSISVYHLLLLYCSYNTANVSVVQPPPCIPPYSFISELILSIIQINPNTLYSYTFSSYNPIAILLYTPLRTLIAL